MIFAALFFYKLISLFLHLDQIHPANISSSNWEKDRKPLLQNWLSWQKAMRACWGNSLSTKIKVTFWPSTSNFIIKSEVQLQIFTQMLPLTLPLKFSSYHSYDTRYIARKRLQLIILRFQSGCRHDSKNRGDNQHVWFNCFHRSNN